MHLLCFVQCFDTVGWVTGRTFVQQNWCSLTLRLSSRTGRGRKLRETGLMWKTPVIMEVG